MALWTKVLIPVFFLGGIVGMYALHRENQALREEILRMEHLLAEKPIELADVMAHFQRFTEKLYWSATAQNWDLAAFYLHELEEASEMAEKARITDEGFPISEMLHNTLAPQWKPLYQTLQDRNKEAFLREYQILLSSCNSCHRSTQKPYIRVQMPQVNPYSSQTFISPAP
ncbi:MAG: hypothetical protein ACUVRD_02085 [Bacteroidia bacterium]